MPTLTINIARAGAPLLFPDGTKDTSTAGHIWYSINNENGNAPISYGFAPNTENNGSPFANGQVYNSDNTHYQGTPFYTRTINISQEQYNKLQQFGDDVQLGAQGTSYYVNGFSTYYNVVTNSCIDFVWKGLEFAGLNPSGFEGLLTPVSNTQAINTLLGAAETLYNDLNGTPVSEQTVMVDGNQVGTIKTRSLTDPNTGSTETRKTVETTINNNNISVTYYGGVGEGGGNVHVNSINNKPPTDQLAANKAYYDLNLSPYELAEGGSGAGSGGGAAGVTATYDATHPTGMQTLTQGIATVMDAITFVNAIKSGQPLPIVASGLRLANDAAILTGNSKHAFSGAANVGGAALSLMSLEASLQRGDTFGAITAGAQTVVYGATAYANFVGNVGSTALVDTFGSGVISGLGEAMPYLNIVNSIIHGDVIGAAVGAISLIPGFQVVGIAYAVFSLVQGLTASTPPPPEAWGNANAEWEGFNTVTRAVGGDGGLGYAEGTYNGFLNYLDQLAAQQEALNPGSSVGVVANRLPSISYRDFSGYTLTDIDPLTGVARAVGTHYDRDGRPYDAPPGSVQSGQQFSERFVRVALEREAIAPQWEVETAALQTQAGDPVAGLTEEERAGRAGKLAPAPTGTEQTFRPVALDLNGDGVQTTGTAKTVAFNVDDSGFYKSTAWVNPNDAFLFLDRNMNGQIDGGRELFSNSTVALSERGLQGMRWVDSNYDGKITALDPVWNEIKVWQDAGGDGNYYTDSNGNGQFDAGEPNEMKTLAQLGITELNYSMGTFTRNGQVRQMGSPDLTANTAGTRTYNVPEGIVIESTNGEISLIVTRIDDKSFLEANRDGVSGYENSETIINSVDLLANDTLAGFPGKDLSLTAAANFIYEVEANAANDIFDLKVAA